MIRTLRHTHFLLLVPVLGIVGFTGCAVGPNYKRPTMDVPGMYRGSTDDAPGNPDAKLQPGQPEHARTEQATASLGDEKWWEVFQDPQLQSLIRKALKNNYDVRIAAARVFEAQAQLGITRADQLPSLSGGGNITSQQSPHIGPIPAYEITQGQLTASAAWNLDFWGKYRRATQAARATLLANEWAKKQVTATLVANLATAYFQLRELDLELEISKRTFNSRNESLQLAQMLRRFRILKGRSHSRKMPSAYFWGITRAMFLADSHSPRSRTLPKFHPEFLHLCWSDGRMFEKPKTASLPPTRRSGWHGRLTFPRSHSPELPVTRVRRLRISSLARPAYGTWPRP